MLGLFSHSLQCICLDFWIRKCACVCVRLPLYNIHIRAHAHSYGFRAENVFRLKSTRSLNLCNRKWESRMLNLFWFRRWWKCMLIHWNVSHCTPGTIYKWYGTTMRGNANGLAKGSERSRIIEEKMPKRKRQNQQSSEISAMQNTAQRWRRRRRSSAEEAFLMGFKWIFSSPNVCSLRC